MELTLDKRGEVAVVTPRVEHLDASNAEDFKRDMTPVLEANPKVLLDMSALSFLDSAGLGALLSCLRRLSGAGGDMKLCGVSRPVRSVFQITRMHRIFDIFDSPEDAISAFQGNAT
ncbi:MAG TPA: STAS domain-containing protein [Chthonomonadaceae bacterium]|nr:STAS domain-containing protein [Chthonomonadaceae bacterium]